MARVHMGHYVLGVEGLALMRTWLTGDRAQAERRVAEIARFLAHQGDPPMSLEFEAPEESVRSGYARWATTYDVMPNPLIRLEQPVVHALIDAMPVGVALDAACGTGRHTRHLRARGHRVVGVDTSDAMLARARADLPDVEFRQGELTAIPAPTAGADLAVCALALTHCPDVSGPISELARVVRPGGRLVVSDFPPLLGLLGGSAFFVDGAGAAGHVRSYVHTHSAYLRAFREAGLEVVQCIEPPLGELEVQLLSGGLSAFAPEAFATAMTGMPGALVWELERR